MPTPRSLTALALAAVLGLGLTACGDDSDDASAASAESAQPETTEAGAAAEGHGDGGHDAGDVPEPGPGTGHDVFVDTFIFRPDPLTVKAGTTVTFTQLDSTTHTITSGTRESPTPELFDASLAKGETFEHTFEEAGTYPYFCTIHNGPGMTGEIVVEG